MAELEEEVGREVSLEQFRQQVLECLKSSFVLPLLTVLVAALSLAGLVDGLLRLMIVTEITYGKELNPILPDPGWLAPIIAEVIAIGLWYLKQFLNRSNLEYQQRAKKALELELPLAQAQLAKIEGEQTLLRARLEQNQTTLTQTLDLTNRQHSKIVTLQANLTQEEEAHAKTKENAAAAQAKIKELEKKVEQAELKADLAETTASNKVLPVVQKLKENLQLAQWAENELRRMARRSTIPSENRGSGEADNRNSQNNHEDIPTLETLREKENSTSNRKVSSNLGKGNRNYLGGA